MSVDFELILVWSKIARKKGTANAETDLKYWKAPCTANYKRITILCFLLPFCAQQIFYVDIWNTKVQRPVSLLCFQYKCIQA